MGLIDLTPDNALMLVRTAVETVLGVRNAPATATIARLRGDSLDRLEIVMALEELSGLDLPEIIVSMSDDSLSDIANNLSNFWALAQTRQNRTSMRNTQSWRG